ncbi:hypothetical protein CPC08DRAFT_738298 [Agrocybe pediades]|nr:hypothetical protein CPC08DRAFT_738298 [Agrocybe pediades]
MALTKLCPGCKKEYQSGRPYGKHLSTCKSLDTVTQQAVKKRASKVKRARIRKEKARELEAEATTGTNMDIEVADMPGSMEIDSAIDFNNSIEPALPEEPMRSPTPPLRPSGRPNRKIRLPLRYRDEPPPQPPLIQAVDIEENGPEVIGNPCQPEESMPQSPVSPTASTNSYTSQPNTISYFAPFLNASIFLLMSWYYDGSSMKSFAQLDSLVNDVIRHEDFKVSNFNKNFSAAREAACMDEERAKPSSSSLPFLKDDGWRTGSVSIRVPCDGVKHASEGDAPCFVVEVELYHITPYTEFWIPPDSKKPERLIGETYTADYFNAEYEKLRSQPRTGPNKDLEPFIAGAILYSDSTHLASFGDASLWPIYMYIGNQSKYIHTKPSEFGAHHPAYIPKLDDRIQDFYQLHFQKPATRDMLTHLRRELMQAVWELILDEDTALISQIGSKLDMRRRVKLKRIDNDYRLYDIGVVRKMMFEDGISITSKKIKDILEPTSAVPTQNAFSKRFKEHGLNFYQLFVPDFMHEVELGVWKALFTHLLRILIAYGHDSIQYLNSRFRQISSFGHGTIHKFSKNASAMKKLAARDFEDLLQCAIPVFEDLLPKKHNRIVQNLLFEFGTWHALAKLRLHTETTIEELETSTERLGSLLRKFKKDVCSNYQTIDLPHEEAARGRRQAALASRNGQQQQPKAATSSIPAKKGAKKLREFNMETYKMHAFGDYPDSIRMFGTSDNMSTQIGESEHRRIKSFYSRTQKGDHVRGIAKHVDRERTLHQTQEALKRQPGPEPTESARVSPEPKEAGLDPEEAESLSPTPPEVHYHLSQDVKNKVDILKWLANNRGDQALVNFLPKLKDHLLNRIFGPPPGSASYSKQDHSQVNILNNRLYRHKVLRVNYTTYDMRRCQDVINPRTHGDIMVLAKEDESTELAHPYWYARVIGIFHAKVCFTQPNKSVYEVKKMDILFVRWFGFDTTQPSGWKAKKLHQLGFLDGNNPEAFGFVDPDEVIRGVHLIPRFSLGRTSHLLRPSIARSPLENDEDWDRYFIGSFVDRDMFMRFRGGGVGHKTTREGNTDFFLSDRDQEDLDRRAKRLGSKDFKGAEQEPARADEADRVEDEELELEESLNLRDAISELLEEMDEEQLIDEMMDYGYGLDHALETLEGDDGESSGDEGDSESEDEDDGGDGGLNSLAALGYAEM